MIKKIKMANIKKHTDLEVKFADGVNVIVGPNYAGKSSILHGILFGLFGVRAIPGTADDFWTDGTSSSSVDIYFEVSDVDVYVHRTRTTATLYEGEALTASGATAVNGRITDLMGVPMADFLRIKYSRQKETAGLLSFGATNLNGLIERVGGISVVKKAIEALTSVAGTSKGVLSVKEMSSLPSLRAVVRDAKAELKKATEDKSATALQRQELSDYVVACNGKLAEAEEALMELKDYQAEEDKFLTKIEELKESTRAAEIALGDLASGAEGQAEAIDAEVIRLIEKAAGMASSFRFRKQLDRKSLEVSKKLEADTSAVLSCQRDIEDSREVAEALPNAKASAKAVVQAEADMDAAKLALTTAQKELDSGACEACGRPFEDGWDVRTAGILAADAEVKEQAAVRQFGKVTRISENIERTRAVWNGLNNTAGGLKLSEKSRRRELEGISAQLDSLPDIDLEEVGDIEVLTEKHRAESKRLRRDLLRKGSLTISLSGYASESIKAQGSLLELRETPPKTTTITSDHILGIKAIRDSATEELHAHDLAASDLNHTCEGLQRELNDAEHYLSQAEEDNLVVTEHTKRLSDATELKKFLSNNREAFMKHTWDRLLAQASTLCSHATGGALSSMQREGDVFSYTEDGRERALTSASGGQESLMGLSLKVALSESIPDSLSCLLLDEVTSDLDEPHSAAVTSLLGNIGCQIITVSHRDMDRSGLFNVISLGD